MSADRLGVLAAGFGGIGTQNHQSAMYLPAFVEHDGFSVVGAVGLPGDLGAEQACRQYGLKEYADIDEALANPSVDVVSVAAPLADRANVIAAALAAGKHVLADKPLAATVQECEELARLAATHDLALVPAHHQRLHGMVRSTRAALAAGRIGLPWNVQVDFLAAGGDPAPSGELVNLALYPIDIVHALLGSSALRVHALAGNYWHDGADDFVTLLLDHEHGVTSTIVCGRTGPLSDVPPGALVVHRYRISGSHGVLLTDARKPSLAVHTAEHVGDRWTGDDTIRALLDVLHRTVRTGQGELGAADAVHTQRVIRAAQQSLDSGRPVSVPAGAEGESA